MPYYCYPPIPERAFRGVGKRSTVELSCQSPPHPDIISFPNPPCICKNKCTAGKIRIQIDQNENPSKTRSLHSILQALFGDSLFMIFGVTMTSLELTHFLQVQGYTSVEQMLGYSGAIDVNNKYNLQPYRQPDSKKNGVAAPACDFDHCPGRPIGEIIAHIIEAGFPCSHASNIKQEYVRAEAEDRCFGFSLLRYAKKTAERSQTRLLVSRRSRISNSLGAGGVKLVEEALARGGKSLADATEEEVNVVIESFDSQRSQTHLLVSRRSHISNSLGAGGVQLVEDALAQGGKSLADATEKEVNAEINTLRSACPGRKAFKTMSAEEESQLNEKISLRHQESLKSYDECLGNKFIEGTGEWKDRTTGPWSEEEIKIIMDAEGHWNSKNLYHILARRLEGRGAGQVGSWIRSHKKKRLA